jgi:DNA-binding NarL/FixJ family response regulator
LSVHRAPVSMLIAATFLVIDDHAESRFLLTKTLSRKFPHASILETDSAEQAFTLIRSGEITVVVCHRTFDIPGLDLIGEFRAAGFRMPILMVSGIEREEAALAAGANAFLHYDEWLRVGTVVESLLKPDEAITPSAEEIA